VARDGRVSGYISLRDQINSTARFALERLREQGIEPAMLSGDTQQAAEAVANELGIALYSGGCSPEDKAAQVSEWQRGGLRVGMAGDGVNDAPALAQADLSITAAGGSDIAGQASDLVLTRSDLRLVPWFIQLSRRTRRIVLENLGWAFAYNLVMVPLAMAGRINPIIASVAMAVSSVVVVINSLRLRQ
jgi:P-type Cu+ transporter